MNSSTPINWKSIFSLSSMAYTILGVFSALIALQGFMIPNHFLDGGITGISILMEEVFHIPLALASLFLIFLFYTWGTGILARLLA
nr:YitT family protein [Antarcticibacterium arcticum]